LDHSASLIVFLLRRYPSQQFNHGGIGMNNKILSCLTAAALGATLALASPALAHGGGGGGHGGGGGGGGGMHGGGMGGGVHSSAAHFSGSRFAGAHVGFAPRFSRSAFHDHRFFDRRHHRFAFIGAPYAYADYDNCWRRVWTAYGLQWVDVCGDDGY
jgi:hypothetical protein